MQVHLQVACFVCLVYTSIANVAAQSDDEVALPQPVRVTGNLTLLTWLGNSTQAPHPVGHTLSDAAAWLNRHGRHRRQAVSGRTPVNIIVTFDGTVTAAQQLVFQNAAVRFTLLRADRVSLINQSIFNHLH